MKKRREGFSLTAILVIVPLIGLIAAGAYMWKTAATFRSMTEENSTVTATVQSVKDSVFWIPNTDTVKVEYGVDGEEYTADIITDKGSVHEGDTTTIFYNPKKPIEAATEDHYHYLMRSYRTQMIIFGAIFVVFLILRILLFKAKGTIKGENLPGFVTGSGPVYHSFLKLQGKNKKR